MYTFGTFRDLVSVRILFDIFRHGSLAEDFTMCMIGFYIEFYGIVCFASYLYHCHLSKLSLTKLVVIHVCRNCMVCNI